MAEIDGCDLIGFLHMRAWKANRDKEKKSPKAAHIDEIWPMLRP